MNISTDVLLAMLGKWKKDRDARHFVGEDEYCRGFVNGADMCISDLESELNRVSKHKRVMVRCSWDEAEQYRSRTLTGSIGLEGPWSEWISGSPEHREMNREYEFRKDVS